MKNYLATFRLLASSLPRLLALFLCFALLTSAQSHAGVQIRRTRIIATGLLRPLGIFHAPSDPNHLYICEKGGVVRVVDITTDTLVPTPFITLPNMITPAEQGLYSIAFHPNYASNGVFYLYHIRGGTENAIVRGTRSTADPLVADPTTTDVLVIPGANMFHNGGFMSFGPDGYLYVAIGDNTSLGNGQSLTTLRSKMLRLDVDGLDNIPGNADDDQFPADPLKNYSIPPTNPWANLPGEDEIWLTGFRNPFRGSFDRQTGDLWIGDVGAESREEVSFIPAGTGGWNMGWPCREGFGILIGCAPWQPYLPPLFDFGFNGSLPIGAQTYMTFRYVIGGYVYRGPSMPCLQGTYFFADGASGMYSIRRTPSGQVTELVDRRVETFNFTPTAYGESLNGELYTTYFDNTELYRIEFSAFTGPDCDNDGVPNDCQIRAGAPDANNNGVPDSCESLCGDIDFNNDGVSPDSADITDFINVFGGSTCPTGTCDSIDFNGDGVSPDSGDIDAFLRVFGGGNC